MKAKLHLSIFSIIKLYLFKKFFVIKSMVYPPHYFTYHHQVYEYFQKGIKIASPQKPNICFEFHTPTATYLEQTRLSQLSEHPRPRWQNAKTKLERIGRCDPCAVSAAPLRCPAAKCPASPHTVQLLIRQRGARGHRRLIFLFRWVASFFFSPPDRGSAVLSLAPSLFFGVVTPDPTTFSRSPSQPGALRRLVSSRSGFFYAFFFSDEWENAWKEVARRFLQVC